MKGGERGSQAVQWLEYSTEMSLLCDTSNLTSKVSTSRLAHAHWVSMLMLAEGEMGKDPVQSTTVGTWGGVGGGGWE